MKRKLITVLSCAVLLTFISAASAAVCDSEFSSLINAVNAATFKNAKEQTTLLARANEAQAKANAGRTSDSLKKLNEIVAKTNTLVSNGKITGGGDAIIRAANSAIACLQGGS
jgi:hypothetical protein